MIRPNCRVLPLESRKGVRAVDQDQIERSLDRVGVAMSAGDPAAVAGCWEVPGLVVSDEGTVLVTDRDQIERFFARAIEAYHAQGLVATRPELERAVALTERPTAVDVRWPSYDATGVERSSERSHYILRLGDDGWHRIQVALTITAS